MKRHILPILMASAMVTASLSGCAGGAQDAADTEMQTQEETQENGENGEDGLESGKVELTVWAGDSYDESLIQMVESFKQEYAGNADFDITVVESSDADTRNAVLNDVYNAGDVFSMPDDQLYSLIAGGGISPVADQDLIRSSNLEEAVEAASYDGTIYAYPYSADNGYFLYYNKDYFTEDDVKTLDGVLAVAKAAGKKVSMEFNSGWYRGGASRYHVKPRVCCAA